MCDRRAFIRRDTPVILEVGAHTGAFFKHMIHSNQLFGVKQFIQTDISEERLNKNYEEIKDLIPSNVEFVQICCNEEDDQPFGLPERSIDMCVSNLSMHWVNDLEKTMLSIRKSLKRDGFLLLSMFGGNTLYELRSSLTMVQTEMLGGVSSHVSPMVDGAGISTLLLQSGFNLPSIDLDRHVLMFETPFHVMEHLGATGEGACHLTRKALPRDVLAGTAAVYQAMYEKNGLIPATFEIFQAIGWSPSPTQAKPLDRGSGVIPLGAISTAEHKELQKVLDTYAQNPTDSGLQEQAENLFLKLRQDTAEMAQRRGVDTRGLDAEKEDVARALSKSQPAPPFQRPGGASSN